MGHLGDWQKKAQILLGKTQLLFLSIRIVTYRDIKMKQRDVYVRISAVGHYSVHRDMSMASCHSSVAVPPITTCVVHQSQNQPQKMTRFPMNPRAPK